MTRQLVLLRHAKSAYPSGVPDQRRPLSERGERDAVAAGLAARKLVPDPALVLVSSATRAQQTWSLAAQAWTHPPRHLTEPRIYEATTDDLLLLIREVDAKVGSLILVGHNPGFEELAFALAADDSDEAAMEAMSVKFPTCALAVFQVEREWPHMVHRSAQLTSFEAPRG